MDLQIIKNNENKLYNRIEIIAKIIHKNESTPKRDDIRKELSARLNKDEKNIIVKSIRTEFGKEESLAKVYVYNDQKDMFEIEPKYILKRNNIINN